MTLRFVASGDAQPPRVAFTTARTGAVTRNRIRRRLRAAVAAHEPMLASGGSYLFGGTPDAARVPFAALADAVSRLTDEAAGGGARG